MQSRSVLWFLAQSMEQITHESWIVESDSLLWELDSWCQCISFFSLLDWLSEAVLFNYPGSVVDPISRGRIPSQYHISSLYQRQFATSLSLMDRAHLIWKLYRQRVSLDDSSEPPVRVLQQSTLSVSLHFAMSQWWRWLLIFCWPLQSIFRLFLWILERVCLCLCML